MHESTLRLQPLLEIAEYIKPNGGRVRLNTDGLANLVHKRNVLPQLAGRIDGLEGVDIDACRQLAHQRGVKFRRRSLDVVG